MTTCIGKSVRFAPNDDDFRREGVDSSELIATTTLVTVIAEVPNREQCSATEIQACWYRPSEYQQINSSIQMEMQHRRHRRYAAGGRRVRFDQIKSDDVNHNDTQGTNDWCNRGLSTTIELERRYRDVQRSINAVLDEQERQRRNKMTTTSAVSTATSSPSNGHSFGCSDTKLLAEVYRGYCISCQFDSERVGRQDAMAAAKIYEENDREVKDNGNNRGGENIDLMQVEHHLPTTSSVSTATIPPILPPRRKHNLFNSTSSRQQRHRLRFPRGVFGRAAFK